MLYYHLESGHRAGDPALTRSSIKCPTQLLASPPVIPAEPQGLWVCEMHGDRPRFAPCSHTPRVANPGDVAFAGGLACGQGVGARA